MLLHQSFKPRQAEKTDLLPEKLMQKCIAISRKSIYPRLSQGAAQALPTFYGEVQRDQLGLHCFSLTMRQIDALIWLTQACARMNLAEEATVDHAQAQDPSLQCCGRRRRFAAAADDEWNWDELIKSGEAIGTRSAGEGSIVWEAVVFGNRSAQHWNSDEVTCSTEDDASLTKAPQRT